MGRKDLIFRTGLSRLGLGAAAILLLPLVYPATADNRWVYAGYLALAALEQALIWRGTGGRARSFLAGLIDLAVVTFTVHRLGSTMTMVVSLYFLAGAFNALVVGARVAMALTLLHGAAYSALVWAEWARVLPFAPDVPALSALGPPSTAEAIGATVLALIVIVGPTAVVVMLVEALSSREAQLLGANTQLAEQGRRDPLTGLYNRRHLFERLEEGLARVRRGQRLAAVMIDLDGFKRINDSQGHQRGDALLVEEGDAITRCTREVDVAARYGGDEFAILLEDADAEQGVAAAQRLVDAVREVGLRFDPERPVTASVGLAQARPDDDALSLLRRADERAYEAKRAGGCRVVSE
jgi:diguanylate cyclase (GGDEF)-like protein